MLSPKRSDQTVLIPALQKVEVFFCSSNRLTAEEAQKIQELLVHWWANREPTDTQRRADVGPMPLPDVKTAHAEWQDMVGEMTPEQSEKHSEDFMAWLKKMQKARKYPKPETAWEELSIILETFKKVTGRPGYMKQLGPWYGLLDIDRMPIWDRKIDSRPLCKAKNPDFPKEEELRSEYEKAVRSIDFLRQ